MNNKPLLELVNVSKYYVSGYIRTFLVPAVIDVNLKVDKGEILALVGESGSGKSTLAKMILRLIKPSSGDILLNGKNINSYPKLLYYAKVQGVFQDPYTSFNPIKTVLSHLVDAITLKYKAYNKRLDKNEYIKDITNIIGKLGMNPAEVLYKYPHELSGGQLQRILLARAFIIEPELLIADEPTSMIDASTRMSVLDLMFRLNKEKNTSIIFITHDLSQAFYVANKVAIMYKGRIIEYGYCDEILSKPKSEYTKQLLSSVPKLSEKWFNI
ncbi:MAG: ATP-binding cassette domain-containing protein [Ignisphaera sp.]|uniref:ABC transporter ATP-binding protein n=1 Tax=Ignisphaera aggregans TaxID=334771 RepID=A0A7C4JK03_9CREN